jgi:hypothetical protein
MYARDSPRKRGELCKIKRFPAAFGVLLRLNPLLKQAALRSRVQQPPACRCRQPIMASFSVVRAPGIRVVVSRRLFNAEVAV